MTTSKSTLKICLNGAPPDTGNLGVSALCNSTLAGIASRLNNPQITVFDFGRGIRQTTCRAGSGPFNYSLCGQSNTRRYYRRESLWNMRISALFGGLGNPGVKIIADAHAVLDISGGDSFTDLYGKRRFDLVTLPKLIALQQRRPLILLPQTYGPFENPERKRLAQHILQQVSFAWARDQRSFEKMRGLLGDAFDSSRHRCGVDVAFSLPLWKPAQAVPDNVQEWIDSDSEIVGFNISGLIYNDPVAAVQQYGFKADYRKAVVTVLKKILSESDVNIVLIPHVLGALGHVESDPEANRSIAAQLEKIANGRMAVLPPVYNESETKWLISKLDWFCGTRMHSTIAGLSTGVPTTAIAYSLKTQGVFETCGQGRHVVDPRVLTTEDVVESLYQSFRARKQARADLGSHLPDVLAQADEQMDMIASACSMND